MKVIENHPAYPNAVFYVATEQEYGLNGIVVGVKAPNNSFGYDAATKTTTYMGGCRLNTGVSNLSSLTETDFAQQVAALENTKVSWASKFEKDLDYANVVDHAYSLAKGMRDKCAAASSGNPQAPLREIAGGKLVVMKKANGEHPLSTDEGAQQVARFLQEIAGHTLENGERSVYITAEDAGTPGNYIETLSKFSPHACGLPVDGIPPSVYSGDPSPVTARVTVAATKQAIERMRMEGLLPGQPGSDMSGLTVIIQGGAGNVGRPSVEMFSKAGASVIVFNRDETSADKAQLAQLRTLIQDKGLKNVTVHTDLSKMYDTQAHIFVPSGPGNVVTGITQGNNGVALVIGSANIPMQNDTRESLSALHGDGVNIVVPDHKRKGIEGRGIVVFESAHVNFGGIAAVLYDHRVRAGKTEASPEAFEHMVVEHEKAAVAMVNRIADNSFASKDKDIDKRNLSAAMAGNLIVLEEVGLISQRVRC